MRLRHELFSALIALAATAATCLAADGLTLPKDLVLPANVAVAIYLPKQVREFRSVFRSAGGFQTTDSVQLGNTFEETTLESARHFFNTSFMYEAAGTPGYGLLVAMHPNVKSEDRQLVATAPTVDLFLNDLAHDNSVRALNDEYQLYFGALAPVAGAATTSQP